MFRQGCRWKRCVLINASGCHFCLKHIRVQCCETVESHLSPHLRQLIDDDAHRYRVTTSTSSTRGPQPLINRSGAIRTPPPDLLSADRSAELRAYTEQAIAMRATRLSETAAPQVQSLVVNTDRRSASNFDINVIAANLMHQASHCQTAPHVALPGAAYPQVDLAAALDPTHANHTAAMACLSERVNAAPSHSYPPRQPPVVLPSHRTGPSSRLMNLGAPVLHPQSLMPPPGYLTSHMYGVPNVAPGNAFGDRVSSSSSYSQLCVFMFFVAFDGHALPLFVLFTAIWNVH